MNDNTNKVQSRVIPANGGGQHLFLARGTARIAAGPGGVADAEWFGWDVGNPGDFAGEGANQTNVGLRADNLWDNTYWGPYQPDHVYGPWSRTGMAGRQIAAYFQDVPGQYGDNSGTLTLEIGQRREFGAAPAAVGDNPAQIDQTRRDHTVVIVMGDARERDPARAGGWVRTARERYGAGAFIYNDVYSPQQLAAKLALFPRGSIRRLIIGGHGTGSSAEGVPQIGVQVTNNDTFAPAGSERIDSETLGAAANRAHLTTIALSLTNDATVEFQSCAPQDRRREGEVAVGLANNLQANVRFAVGFVTRWDTLYDPMDPAQYWSVVAPTMNNETIRDGRTAGSMMSPESTQLQASVQPVPTDTSGGYLAGQSAAPADSEGNYADQTLAFAYGPDAAWAAWTLRGWPADSLREPLPLAELGIPVIHTSGQDALHPASRQASDQDQAVPSTSGLPAARQEFRDPSSFGILSLDLAEDVFLTGDLLEF